MYVSKAIKIFTLCVDELKEIHTWELRVLAQDH